VEVPEWEEFLTGRGVPEWGVPELESGGFLI
jgi:hypothetical protein